MLRSSGTALRLRWVLATLALAAGSRPVAAELADVYLRSGLRLRADVTVAQDAVILRNAAGEVRIPRMEVERLVWVPAEAASQPASEPASTATTAPVEVEPAPEGAVPGPLGRPTGGELPPAPPISKRDIQRLKLHELRRDDPPELVRVQFDRRGRQPDLAVEILEELRKRTDFEPRWEQVLTRGQPHEKLQMIVRLTGTRYADRIEILSDPEVFLIYRQRVLPLINNSCARSGCHAGTTARAFRLPIGSKTGDAYAYTTFAVLDAMQGSQGLLIDREHPDDSLLLCYMLPPERNPRAHPPVGRGPSFKAVIWGREDPQYEIVLDWIRRLARPHPEYELEYQNLYAVPLGVTLTPRESEPVPPAATQEADADGPPPEEK